MKMCLMTLDYVGRFRDFLKCCFVRGGSVYVRMLGKKVFNREVKVEIRVCECTCRV
jgi:hypothetical protein